MKVNECIANRRSIRKFKNAPVNKEQAETLVKAAMAAPSGRNTKLREYIVVQDRALLDKLAKEMPYSKMLYTASLAIIVCGAYPEPLSDSYFTQDCAAATENILLQAVELGLGTCWCGVYPRRERVEIIQRILNTDKMPLNLIAVGVPDENPAPRSVYDPAKVTWY